MKNAASHQGRIAITSELPFPVANGINALPGGVKEAVRFTTERGAPQIKEHWEEQLGRLDLRAQLLMPRPWVIRGNFKLDQDGARARLRILLSEEFLDKHGMGRRAWREQFIAGSPRLGA